MKNLFLPFLLCCFFISAHAMESDEDKDPTYYPSSEESSPKRKAILAAKTETVTPWWVRVRQDNQDKRRQWIYLCQRCNNKSVVDIIRHNRALHSDERPYACDSCGKAFAESSACTNHITRQHSDLTNPTYTVQLPNKEPYKRTVIITKKKLLLLKKRKRKAASTESDSLKYLPSVKNHALATDKEDEENTNLSGESWNDEALELLLNQEFPEDLQETPADQ